MWVPTKAVTLLHCEVWWEEAWSSLPMAQEARTLQRASCFR